jgi:hypothetical protein
MHPCIGSGHVIEAASEWEVVTVRKQSIVGRLLFVVIGLSLSCGEESESLESQCEDISAEARRQLTIADEDTSCSIDTDCVLVVTDVSCLSGCGLPIASSQASSVPERVQDVESELCIDHERLGCPMPLLLPCLPPIAGQSAVCNSGRCEVQNPE